MSLLGRRIISFDVKDNHILYGLGNYSFGKVKVKKFGEFDSNIKFEPDDLIVVNLPWDLILHLTIDVPGITKEKELREYLTIEISQNLGIDGDELYFDYVKPFTEKANVFVVKKMDLHLYLEKLTSYGIPEPDVIYPDILKEMILLTKFTGLNLYFIISQDYSGTIIMTDNNFDFMRFSYLTLEYINRVTSDEFGMNLYEIEKSDDIELKDRVRQFLKPLTIDLISEIEREALISINSTDGQVTTEILNGITIVTDSKLINESIEQNYALGEILKQKYISPHFKFLMDDMTNIGCMGLLMRGGMEIGKVKFVY
ncbi:MAG: hypothetical protein H0Z24_00725 [Thermosipho sp. (in: Bacteria)]|nr:hypothetical protein [Thermosipho sp. (in: thermotogales)]